MSVIMHVIHQQETIFFNMAKFDVGEFWHMHCKCFPHKNYSTGNYRVPAGIPCKNHRETLCILRGNPVIFTDCGEIPVIITCILQGPPATWGFPALFSGKKFAVYIYYSKENTFWMETLFNIYRHVLGMLWVKTM